MSDANEARQTGPLERLVGRKADYEMAGIELARATRDAYPIGTRISLIIGKSTILAEVESAGGSWWYRPDYLNVRNVRTGKQRRISATSEGNRILILHRPNAELSRVAAIEKPK